MADALRAHLEQARDSLGKIVFPTSYTSQAAIHIRRALAELDTPRDAEPEPEIVTTSEARALPEHSIVVRCDSDGVPRSAYMPMKVRDLKGFDQGEKYRVLYRVPAPPIVVGSELRTEVDYDRAPLGTVVRRKSGIVMEKKHGAYEWRDTDGDSFRSSTLANRPATVLYVSEESK